MIKENENKAALDAVKKTSEQTEKAVGSGKCNYDDVLSLFDSVSTAPVELTDPEIHAAQETRKKYNKQYKAFNVSPIYRSLHALARSLFEIVKLMPKKSTKVSDVVLQYFAEVCRWTASAYEQDRIEAKHLSLNEAISLMNTVRIFINSAFQVQFVGRAKSTELSNQCDHIMRQLVAWRGSLQDQGDCVRS